MFLKDRYPTNYPLPWAVNIHPGGGAHHCTNESFHWTQHPPWLNGIISVDPREISTLHQCVIQLHLQPENETEKLAIMLPREGGRQSPGMTVSHWSLVPSAGHLLGTAVCLLKLHTNLIWSRLDIWTAACHYVLLRRALNWLSSQIDRGGCTNENGWQTGLPNWEEQLNNWCFGFVGDEPHKHTQACSEFETRMRHIIHEINLVSNVSVHPKIYFKQPDVRSRSKTLVNVHEHIQTYFCSPR